ncbi:MAG: M48 family metalloprotease [Candidatus Polarisedimenticolia bacterium]
MPRRPRETAAALALGVLAAGALAAWGCAKNPVTGQRQMMLITEEQEFSIGQGADEEIRKEFGSYLDSPALRTYVDEIGNRLARQGERPGLVFHFEVLNDPQINAFALPGGFVYVTRGILERLSSDDELSMVLGHEIGHVTARHGAARLSKMYALQYGSLVGVLISPRTFANYGDLIDLALQVGMSAYSRDQESQADDLGVAYTYKAGFRPQEGVTVMRMLQWLEGREPGKLERWFRTHPPPSQRIVDIETSLRALEQSDPEVAARRVSRDSYLRRIDGLLVGQYNGAEMVLRDGYYNRELAVRLAVPSGWEVNLDPNGSLVSMRKKEDEIALLDADPMRTSIEAADVEKEFEKTLKRRGWRRTGGRQDHTAQQVLTHLATYEGRTAKDEPIAVLNAYMAHGKHAWTFTAAAKHEIFKERLADYEAWALGLRFLEEREAAALTPPRLRIETAGKNATWRSLAEEHLGDPNAAEQLAFYNSLDPNAPLAPGLLVKIPPTLTVRP